MRAFVLITACLILAGQAVAEHEADHRYQVRGYVLDENEDAIRGREVIVSAEGSVLARGKTDSAGYYSLHLHLHNEDRGRRLQLRAGPYTAEIRVSLDPDDRQTARIHEASLVGGRLVEKELNRWRTPPWLYALAGLVLFGFVLVALERRRKRRLVRKQLARSGEASSGGRQRKKKRRKKH